MIAFSQQEDDLLSGEELFFEACFCALKIVDYVALFEFSFERFEYFSLDAPVLITTNAVRDLRLADADMRNYRDLFVVASEIAERRKVVVVLGHDRGRQNEQNDRESKYEFQG